MVCGFRYNARILARFIAESAFEVTLDRPLIDPPRLVPFLVSELNHAPELSIQKGYLARVVDASDEGLRDAGILPLEAFVDGSNDGVAATLEFDQSETISPVLYVRRNGVLREIGLPSHPLRRYDALSYREALEDVLRPWLPR